MGAAREQGEVESVAGDYARASGLAGAMAGELLELPSSGAAVVARLERDRVVLERLDPLSPLAPGDLVRRTGRLLEVPVGGALRGRVVDALGRPLDGAGPIGAHATRRLSAPAPSLSQRAPLSETLWTGVKQLDLFSSISAGERVLLAGGPRTGKSTLALDAVLGQAGRGVTCVVAPLREPAPGLGPLRAVLGASPGLDWTVVAGGGVLAPLAAIAIAGHARSEGRAALVVLDDLEFHRLRWARRAYPLLGHADEAGHRFALANLLAHAGPARGGGSLTLLATTSAQDGALLRDLRQIADARSSADSCASSAPARRARPCPGPRALRRARAARASRLLARGRTAPTHSNRPADNEWRTRGSG